MLSTSGGKADLSDYYRGEERDLMESQNTEFKSSWRDEYLKVICAFANADGGKLIIGIDDKG
jgi:ATP-dependent DNA helicase RecG